MSRKRSIERSLISSKRFYRYSLVLIFSFSFTMIDAQHKTFAFNSEGDQCYMKYVTYAPNGNYSSVKRPFIFVLSDKGVSPLISFERDSLKDLPQFYNYRFIYLPNLDSKKIGCLKYLTPYITYNYSPGKENIFLYVVDPAVDTFTVELNQLENTFGQIKYVTEIKSEFDLTSSFKEDREAYYKGPANFDEQGTYYVDETSMKTDREKEENVVSKKTYFGEPSRKNYTISGAVKDKTTGETLPFANILIEGTTQGTTSNQDGYFTLRNVPTDTAVLVAKYVGYFEKKIYLTPAMPEKGFQIELIPANNLKALDVIVTKEDVVLSKENDVSVVKMTPKKLEKLPNLGEKDVMRSFQLMPGVSAANESSSGLYVRGGTPDQNLVLFDGFTVYHVDHLYGFFSAFNTNALKDVQLYKGGFQSKFGGRLSSVTEITGKEGNQKKFNIGGDISLLSFNAFVEIPIGTKFSSIITYRRSYKGFLYNKIFNKFNNDGEEEEETSSSTPGPPGGRGGFSQSEPSSYFYDLNGKFTYRPNDKDILSLSFYNGADKLDNSTSSPDFGGGSSNFSFETTDITDYGNIGSSVKWSRKWTDRLYGNTIFSYSNYYSERDRSQLRTTINANDDTTETSTGVFENNDLRDFSLKSDYELDLTNHLKVQFGGFASYYDIQYDYSDNDTAYILNKKNTGVLAGGYLQSEVEFLSGIINLQPGIRYSYYEPNKTSYYEPRFAANINATDKLHLKAATGKYYQFATKVTREDILSGNKEFWLLADGNSIPVSSANHYIAGLEYNAKKWLFSIEGYYKTLSDLTEYSLRFNTSPEGTDYQENFYSGDGYSRGVEFLVQRKSGKLNGWVSYTLGEARSQFDVYGENYIYANQDVRHEFKAVAMYNYKRFDFSATWVYASGRPYTSPSGAYTVTLLDGSEQEYFTVTSKNGLRLADYHRADISVTYKLLTGSKEDKMRKEIGSIGFSIFNIYNRKNIWYKQYTIEDGSIYETDVNYVGFTPNLTLSLKLR